jgi:ABC-type antimicrobial peptide transport system permease subunit
MSLSLLEQTREFGICLAMGTRKRTLVARILNEAALTGIIGLITGAVVPALLYIFPEFTYPMPMILSELGAPLAELKAKIDETWGRL